MSPPNLSHFTSLIVKFLQVKKIISPKEPFGQEPIDFLEVKLPVKLNELGVL
jgi:hypothetical protein